MTCTRKLRAIILGVFDKRQHNRQYMRLIWRYLPGKALKDWTAENAMINGHVYMISYFVQLTEKYKTQIISQNYMDFIYNQKQLNITHQNIFKTCKQQILEHTKIYQETAFNIIQKYPDRCPIYAIKYKYTDAPSLLKDKFVVPNNLTINQFIYVLQKRMNSQQNNILLLVNGIIYPDNTIINILYEKHKNENGFLYVIYSIK